MIKKDDFIEKTITLIKKLLQEYLPEEAILEEMINKRDKLLQKFIK